MQKFTFKRKLKPKGEPIESIPKSFKLKRIRNEVIKYHFRNQKNGDRYVQSVNVHCYRRYTERIDNPMYTSPNSHKKTNKR